MSRSMVTNTKDDDKDRMLKMMDDLRRQLKESQEESHARSVALEAERRLMGAELRAMSKELAIGRVEKETLKEKLAQVNELPIKDIADEAAVHDKEAEAEHHAQDDAVQQDQAAERIAALEHEIERMRRVWMIDKTNLLESDVEEWKPATITAALEDGVAVVQSEDGLETCVVPAAELVVRHDVQTQNTDNLAEIPDLNPKDPNIMQLLMDRYKRQLPFTFVASVLLYIHASIPATMAPPPQMRRAYQNCTNVSDLPPHIFSMLETAYRSMRMNRDSQTVILSGERGSGKSTLTRAALGYLMTESNDRASHGCHRVLDAMTVLESFTNARTAQNRNSSFASAVYEIQYDSSGLAVGAVVSTFCFDKHRLCSQKPGEYSFAVFYQMCAGASEAEKKTLHLHGASKFPYLNLNRDDTIYHDYVDQEDARKYRNLKNAMNSLGLGNVERAAILRMLSAILWLGEVRFVMSVDGGRAMVWDGAVIDVVANLLRCNSSDLENALTEPGHIKSKVQQAEITNNDQQAESGLYRDAVYARDSLAKALYTRVLNWLVERANAILSRDDVFSTITVLDVNGYEASATDNDFGTFCRNYANECLQELFNKMHFEAEMREYESEGITVPAEHIPNNSGCVNLLERHGGVISLLDQQSQFTQTSVGALVNNLNAAFSRDAYYVKSRTPRGFQIKHTEGVAHYTANHVVDYNRDLLPEAVLDLMDRCKCKFLLELFPASSNFSSATKISRPVTMASQLKNQLAALFRNISMTSVYFVRCLATTRTLHPDLPTGGPLNNCIDIPYVQNQLMNSKVVDILDLRMAGYPARSYFEDFFLRYKMFSPSMSNSDNLSYRTQCEYIMEHMGFERRSWQAGRSKVYFKEVDLEALEAARNRVRHGAVVKLQAIFRRNHCLGSFESMWDCSLSLQTILRGLLARQVYIQEKENRAMQMREHESREMELGMASEDEQEAWETKNMLAEEDSLADVQAMWRSELHKSAFEVAQTAFDDAMRGITLMDAMWMRDFDSEGGKHHVIKTEAIQEVVEDFCKSSLVELAEQVAFQKKEQKMEALNAERLETEENYLRKVRIAKDRRRDPHPLEELAAMRAEDAFAIVLERMERLEALEESWQDGTAEQGPSGKEMLQMISELVTSGDGLLMSELHRQQQGSDHVYFSDPIEVHESEENIDYLAPDSDDEREKVEREQYEREKEKKDKAKADRAKQEKSDIEAKLSANKQEQARLKKEQEDQQTVSKEAGPAGGGDVSEPGSPEDDRSAIQRMIEERRKARNPSRPVFSADDDELFTDVENELNALKQKFFHEESGELQFVPSADNDGESPSLHRFKYLAPSMKHVRKV